MLKTEEATIGNLTGVVIRLRKDNPAGIEDTIQKLYAVRGQERWYMVAAAASIADFDAAELEYDEIAGTLWAE